MTEVIMRFPEPVCDPRGVFTPCVMGRQGGDGGWEAWLEFTAVGAAAAPGFVTGVETHQRDRMALGRWASGLTRVYAEGALARARPLHPATRVSELLQALQELVEALDRRIPHVERASEAEIAADAKRLRAAAVQRIAELREEASAPDK
jgi:hypothetical protein